MCRLPEYTPLKRNVTIIFNKVYIKRYGVLPGTVIRSAILLQGFYITFQYFMCPVKCNSHALIGKVSG